MTKTTLIGTVTDFLARVGHGITFEIIEGGVRREDSWWYVPVVATRKGKELPREVTVNIYANIEDQLEQTQRVNVLLVPAVPDEDARSSKLAKKVGP